MKQTLKIICLFAAVLLVAPHAFAQQAAFTRQDTLRGSITPERSWWDLTYYHLDIRVNPADSTVAGTNTVMYKVLKPYQVMQIDLQPPMHIDKITQNGSTLEYRRDGNAYFVTLKEKQVQGAAGTIEISFGGKPIVAKRPPWNGGLTWHRDSAGKPFVGTSCQGDGASMWWPCKDHQYDEPDSMMISVEAPDGLIAVSNGRLVKTDRNRKNKTNTFHWFVSNPINNYGVSVDIGDYVHFGEKYEGEKGTLDCDYYVLRENEAKAKAQFTEVKKMLEAFEHWFGPYPFYEDGYKLVETPFLGMEHQSAIAYGNEFGDGYLGRDLSRSGWGLKFDYIIVHESAHEWFGNSITSKDIADMWIHESFADYSENIYVDYQFGKEAASEYVLGQRSGIGNVAPIIGTYNVNHGGSGDMYPKGANVLHMLRQLTRDDEKWRMTLRGLSEKFYHQTVEASQIENYFSDALGLDLSAFFDQYLRDIRVPILEYRMKDDNLEYRWSNCVTEFAMPVRVWIGDKETWITPKTRWGRVDADTSETFTVDPNFYVASFNLVGK